MQFVNLSRCKIVGKKLSSNLICFFIKETSPCCCWFWFNLIAFLFPRNKNNRKLLYKVQQFFIEFILEVFPSKSGSSSTTTTSSSTTSQSPPLVFHDSSSTTDSSNLISSTLSNKRRSLLSSCNALPLSHLRQQSSTLDIVVDDDDDNIDENVHNRSSVSTIQSTIDIALNSSQQQQRKIDINDNFDDDNVIEFVHGDHLTAEKTSITTTKLLKNPTDCDNNINLRDTTSTALLNNNKIHQLIDKTSQHLLHFNKHCSKNTEKNSQDFQNIQDDDKTATKKAIVERRQYFPGPDSSVVNNPSPFSVDQQPTQTLKTILSSTAKPSSSTSSTLKNVIKEHDDEVELISLIENQNSQVLQQQIIPQYKLRLDTITKFVGYRNNDWFIETPLIDLEAPIDLNPVLLRETFKLFLQSGQRLTQMTKVYNDVDALTKLLEEKERDVELAARIGQSLLDQNQQQTERIDELEQELTRAKDKITQLKHEVSSKSDLLRFYISAKEEDDDEQTECFDDELNLTSISSQPSFNKDASQILDDLERKVITLEEENNRLKAEKENKANNLEDEERKELQLINECARRLSQTNKQIASLQEEISNKTNENQRLSKELQNLKQQVNTLEKQIRNLNTEKDELVGALNLAHECQSELTLELIDVKDKHNNLLAAFHEKQEECRQLRQQQFNDPIFSYVDSLAYELENSFHSCQYDDNTSMIISADGECASGSSSGDLAASQLEHHHHLHHHHHHHHTNSPVHVHHNLHQQHQHSNNCNPTNCFTPDSLLSTDSFYTSSPYSSIVVASTLQPTSNSQQQQPSSQDQLKRPTEADYETDSVISKSSFQLSTPSTTTTMITSSSIMVVDSSKQNATAKTTTLTTLAKVPPTHHLHHHHYHKNYFQTNKLRYIKPIEGSQILNHWRRLANPNLNDLFEDKDRYVSRIKANLVAAEVGSRYIKDEKEQILDPEKINLMGTNESDKSSQRNLTAVQTSNSYTNNFVTTNSVFTFTTTSLSHTKETMTEVTTTFSDVQPSTGKNEFSVDKHHSRSQSPIHQFHPLQRKPSTSSTKTTITPTSLAQLHNRISLVEQVKSILKVDQLSSSTLMSLPEPSISSANIPHSSGKLKTEKQTESMKTSPVKKLDSNQNPTDSTEQKADRISGLNELAKLFSLNPQPKRMTSLDRRKQSNFIYGTAGGGSRMISKIQMTYNNNNNNNNVATNKLSNVGSSDSKSGNNSSTTGDQQSSPYRTNLSVLRNLRKGGLI